MDYIKLFLDFVLHMDVRLAELVALYGVWVYAFLFIVVFCETGLVATPILPGDSLLFAAGAVAATNPEAFSPHMVVLLLLFAPFLGDNVNYWVGYKLGPKVFSKPKSLFFNPDHLNKTHHFYEKHGAKMVIIARFLPIIRTFAPFVAGIGKMRYSRFIAMSSLGTVLWVPTFVYAGYFFGGVPFIKKNFTLVIFGIIFVSLIPAVLQFIGKKAKSSSLENSTPS